MDGITKGFITREEFPLVIEPENPKITLQEALELLAVNQEFIRENLLTYGGILFRNFPVLGAEAFANFISALKLGKSINYIGGDSPRNKVHGAVYTSTEAPPSFKIPLHNELSFVKNYPKHIYFHCEIAPAERGETTIADARKIVKAIDPAVKQRLIDNRLEYSSSYYFQSTLMEWLNKFQRSHKSWPEVFETYSKAELEKKCHENDFQFQWNKDDWINIKQLRPATILHPETKEEAWFNQIHLYDFNPKLLGFWRYVGAKMFYFQKHMRLHEIAYADGSKIARKDIYHIMDTLDAHTVYFPWQKGDVMALDNVLAMHGRSPFKGKRRILAAMTS